MVSALLNDALRDPCSIIVELQNEQESNNSTQPFPSRVAQYFQGIFKEDDAFKQIPALNATYPPEQFKGGRHSLVRFRAMVQDTSTSPEVYPSLLRNGKPGGWGFAEAEPADEALDLQYLSEREVVWVIAVPGESPYVAEILDDAEVPASCVEAATSVLPYKDPLMRAGHIGAQVKLYDSTAALLKPTEVHTFVGLLTVEHLSSEGDGAEGLEVPTLHTLFSVKHCLALIPSKYLPSDHGASLSPAHDRVDPPAAAIKDELLQWISNEALGGDHDAALWVILVAIARVQSRLPPLFPPSLTLSKFPRHEEDMSAPPPPALSYVLQCLFPLFVDVPLTLSLINTRLFAPESRNETLHAGLLQLPAGTTILLSDSGVQEGKITETGVKNIQTLRNVLTTQTLDYHFPFVAPYQFPTDLSFILLTEGKNSTFVETLVDIPLQCKRPRDCYRRAEDIQLPSADRMDAFRRLLAGAKKGKVEITDEVSQHIQADFVHQRQEDKTITGEDLMTRMSIARLMALLLHNTVLTTEVWQEAKELDQRRKRRF
ncbi:hypothetical protein JB92DRAFT_2920727 [Gautieria morchelliformis]|nr:hypothetical protein JB92DRAFT_2920727 [Gautieria morchelliformis]